MIHSIFVICYKEIKEAYRDWRALLTIVLVSVLAGPLLLLMLAKSLASFEARAERNIVIVKGLQHSPSLSNYLARETASVVEAPENIESDLLSGKLLDPVLIVPENFDVLLHDGLPVELLIMTNASSAQVNAGVTRLKRKLSGYIAEKNNSQTLYYGLSFKSPFNLQIQDYDISNRQAEAAKVFGMMPYFLVLAALYGVWAVSLDSSVGERERGTLDALMVSANNIWSIVIGKWLATFIIGMAIVAIAVVTFIPAQAMMPGETLKSMFAFGWREAMICVLLLWPLVAFFSSLLIWIGVGSTTIKHAHTITTGVLLLSTLLPLSMHMSETSHHILQLTLPVIAQHTQIMAMIKGEVITLQALLMAALVNITCASILLFATHQTLKKR